MSRARLLILLLALVPSPALAGAISGTVIDRTANRPAPGVEVLLILPEKPEPEGRAISDVKGHFNFPDVAPGEYVLGASHLGVPYLRRDVRVEAGRHGLTADLEVFQTTTDASNLSIGGDHILVEPEGDGARALEIVVYENAGDRTYLGETTPASPTGHRLVVPLPEGYTELDAPPGIREQIANRTETGFDLALPLLPGQTQMAFTYRVPGGLLGVNLDRRFRLPVKSASVLVPKDHGWRVRSDDLSRMRTVALEGRNFMVATGGPFPPGKIVAARAAAGMLGTSVSPARLAWGAGGLAIAGLSLAWILLLARPGAAPGAA